MNKKYKLTKEHEEALETWAEPWIENAMSTKAMTEEDREICKENVIKLYQAADLPPPKNIVFVSSPFVMRFAAGFASAIWHLRKNSPTGAATLDATLDATWDATEDATYDATYDATRAATRDATRDATEDATYDATRDATDGATYDAIEDATWRATGAATEDATYDATYDATLDATRDATEAATWCATEDATWRATRAATDGATLDATFEATRDATLDATWDATLDATEDATRAATDGATLDATFEATLDATEDATYDATRDATYDATRDATYDATDDATWRATLDATGDATRDATDGATGDAARNANDGACKEKWYSFPTKLMSFIDKSLRLRGLGIKCSSASYNLDHPGNQWSGPCAHLSFFRNVAKLDIDFSKYEPWEKLCLHGSRRVVHKDFCIISDRPEVLKVDDRNRPHCEDGPFCKWRDGSSLYSWHGTRVPGWIIENPELITIDKIHQEDNAEVRRVMMERYGMERYGEDIISSGKAILIDEKEVWGENVKLYKDDSDDISKGFVHVINGTTEEDGSKHEFVIPCKIIDNDAERSVYGTYPELVNDISKYYPGQEMTILKNSIRT